MFVNNIREVYDVFVVKSITQLEEAIRGGAREVMVVGKLAPEVLETSGIFSENAKHDFSADFNFTNLFTDFNIHAIHDSSQKLIATVFQQRDDISME
jgi:hypothetical protein